jgi:uncharacterized protein YueI
LPNRILLDLDDPELILSKFPRYWRGLNEEQRRRKLGDVVERVLLDLDGKELTIQFKEGIELIVERLSQESAC